MNKCTTSSSCFFLSCMKMKGQSFSIYTILREYVSTKDVSIFHMGAVTRPLFIYFVHLTPLTRSLYKKHKIILFFLNTKITSYCFIFWQGNFYALYMFRYLHIYVLYIYIYIYIYSCFLQVYLQNTHYFIGPRQRRTYHVGTATSKVN